LAMSQGRLLSEYEPDALQRPPRRQRATGPSRRVTPLRPLPSDRDRASLLDVRDAFLTFDDLLLPRPVRELFAEVHLEQLRADDLAQHALSPRRRFLLVGPPGCGKTATAEAFADELGWQLATVNLPAMVSSFLGDTAKNLAAVFETAATAELVVLCDEFDAIAKTRDDDTEHGELHRVVTSFLQLIDRFAGPSIIIAASNHPELLDRAVWRRFDEVVRLDLPSVHEIRSLIRLKLRALPRERGFNVDRIAHECKNLSHAEVVRVLDDARRHQVLHDLPGSALREREVIVAAQAAQQRAAVAKPSRRR
jgi:SpoVK/Ycf46/Vps4 family AAA+-type ATPase